MPTGLTSPADAAALDPVERQLAGYNAGDIEAFLSPYHPEVVIARHPGNEVLSRGLAPMRARYGAMFKKNPKLHCEVVTRIVSGEYVMDHEVITGVESQPVFDAVAMYHVADGLIDRVWFLPRHYRAEPPKPVTALVGAVVVHPWKEGADALVPDQTIILEGDRITAVGPSASTGVPPGARTIDVRGKWVTAGLVDTHVHFFQSGGIYTRPDAIDLRKNRSYESESAQIRTAIPLTLRRWLASGVTSIVDVGGPFWNFEVREQARNSLAPRVLVTGPLVSTAELEPVHRLDLDDPPIIAVKTPEEAQALVKRELTRKPDFVKVWFLNRPGDDLVAQEKICKAVGDAAHAAGVRLAVHATQLEVAKAALRAGADLLVHSVYDKPLDDEFIQLAKQRNVLYSPTLNVYDGYLEAFTGTFVATEEERRLADPDVLATLDDILAVGPADRPAGFAESLIKRKENVPAMIATAAANLKRALEAGIAVTLATDAGNIGTVHGPSVFREMRKMVAAGLSTRQVLTAATVNGARFLNLPNELGTVEAGRLADLVVVDANPLDDVSNMAKVSWVVRAGQPLAIDELMRGLGQAPPSEPKKTP